MENREMAKQLLSHTVVRAYFLWLRMTQAYGKQMMEAIRGSLSLKQLVFIATVPVDVFK